MKDPLILQRAHCPHGVQSDQNASFQGKRQPAVVQAR